MYLGILGLLDEVEDDVPVPFKKRKTSDSAGKNKATPKSVKKATPGIYLSCRYLLKRSFSIMVQ